MPEVIRYLQLTGESSLNVDHFTFDWRVRTDNVVAPVRQLNTVLKSITKDRFPFPQQCFAANIFHSCQQYCSVLSHTIQAPQYCSLYGFSKFSILIG